MAAFYGIGDVHVQWLRAVLTARSEEEQMRPLYCQLDQNDWRLLTMSQLGLRQMRQRYKAMTGAVDDVQEDADEDPVVIVPTVGRFYLIKPTPEGRLDRGELHCVGECKRLGHLDNYPAMRCLYWQHKPGQAFSEMTPYTNVTRSTIKSLDLVWFESLQEELQPLVKVPGRSLDTRRFNALDHPRVKYWVRKWNDTSGDLEDWDREA